MRKIKLKRGLGIFIISLLLPTIMGMVHSGIVPNHSFIEGFIGGFIVETKICGIFGIGFGIVILLKWCFE